MAETTQQTYANHVRFHPLFHFFLAPGSLVLIALAVVDVVRHPSQLDPWFLLLLSVPILRGCFPAALLSAEGAGDRIIRLEERLRLQSVLPAVLRPRIPELTEARN